LVYYGEFAGIPWPVRIDDSFYRPPDEKERTVEERLLSIGFEPEYFIITNFDLYDRMHQDLRAYLEDKLPVISGPGSISYLQFMLKEINVSRWRLK
jgi:hypothetical protein